MRKSLKKPQPYLALETSLLGGFILLKRFDPSNSFEVLDLKMGIFGQNYLKNRVLDQKVLEL